MTRAGRLVLGIGALLSAALGAGRAAAVSVAIDPERPSPGQVFRARVEGASAQGTLELRLGSRAFALWRTAPEAWEGLAALDRDDTAAVREYFVVDVFAQGERLLAMGEVPSEPREYGYQEIKVDEGMVTLSARDQERADRENAVIRAAFNTRTPERLWTSPLGRPTPGEVSGPYGVRRVYNGKPKGYHNGVDIAVPRGTPVSASAAGRVALVGDYFYTGHTVFIDHGLGLYTAYFHMDSAAVVEGEKVEAGTIVGLVGSTGRSTGPHLHWGVYLSGLRVDPGSLLAAAGGGAVAGATMPAPQGGEGEGN